MQSKGKAAFTLLEMAIVVLIIAVIISGVLVGQSMLATSRMQTIITDSSNYISAVGNFKQSYQALPGDFTGATSQWGTDSAGCPNGGSGSSGTCDGDGNGKIGNYCSPISRSLTGSSLESFRIWQHLNSAGLLINSLSGKTAAAGNFVPSFGINIPKAAIDGSGFVFTWMDGPDVCNAFKLLSNSATYGNTLILTGPPPTALEGYFVPTPILTPEQALSIDSKIDDSMPGTGNVRNFGDRTPGCTTTTDSTTAAYALTSDLPLCAPIFLTGY